MNSPFVVQQATNLVETTRLTSLTSDEERIRRLYQLAFQRSPEPEEIQLASKFIQSQAEAAPPADTPAWQYGWGEYDQNAQRVTNFQPLPHFTKYAWQGGTNLPDTKLGWVLLTAEGGHPGNDRQHAAIRRWVAPHDGAIHIKGE